MRHPDSRPRRRLTHRRRSPSGVLARRSPQRFPSFRQVQPRAPAAPCTAPRTRRRWDLWAGGQPLVARWPIYDPWSCCIGGPCHGTHRATAIGFLPIHAEPGRSWPRFLSCAESRDRLLRRSPAETRRRSIGPPFSAPLQSLEACRADPLQREPSRPEKALTPAVGAQVVVIAPWLVPSPIFTLVHSVTPESAAPIVPPGSSP